MDREKQNKAKQHWTNNFAIDCFPILAIYLLGSAIYSSMSVFADQIPSRLPKFQRLGSPIRAMRTTR